MKNILTILSFFLCLNGFSQSLYIPSNPDSIKVPVNVNGAVRTVYNIDLTKYRAALTARDTAAALRLLIASNTSAIAANTTAIALKASKPVSVYYLSQSGVVSDADLSAGSTTFGADQTTAIQTVLNNGGAANPIIIYWDVKASVTGLTIKGNTHIIALPGMGAILRNNSNKSLIRNANIVFGGTPIDSNIVIEGGTWNGNAFNSGLSPAQTIGTSTTGPTCVFMFNGVNGLIVRDFTMYRQRAYAIAGNNIKNGLYENGVIDAGAGAINSDGVHFDGNSQHCTARNLRIKAIDDAVALNADDLYVNNTGSLVNGFYNASSAGPVTDISIENIFIDGGQFGIRLLSGSSRIDNVRIKNVTGNTTGYGLIIDNYFQAPTTVTASGAGNVGTVHIENFNVAIKVIAPNYTNTANALINGNIEKLIFKDFKRTDYTLNQPSILIQGSATVINDLIVDGFDVYDSTSSAATSGIYIAAGATVKNLHATRVAGTRKTGTNLDVFINNLGTLTNLTLNGIYLDKFYSVLSSPSAMPISSIIGTNISHTNGTYSFTAAPGSTVPEITLSNVRGGTTILNGTFTSQKGDAFGTINGSNISYNNTNKSLQLGGSAGSTWASQNFVLDAGNNSILYGTTAELHMISNAYYNTNAPSGWKYYSTGTAVTNGLFGGDFVVRAAASGSANAALTWGDKLHVFNAGNVTINSGTDDGTNKLQVTGNVKATQYRLSALNTAPASATATGTLGEIRIDAGFIYVCVATNTWVRSALTTW